MAGYTTERGIIAFLLLVIVDMLLWQTQWILTIPVSIVWLAVLAAWAWDIGKDW
jgi:hypothetical protein